MKKMLKFLAALIILASLKIHCVPLYSQATKDTICLPVQTVKNLYIQAEQGKNAKDKISVYEKQISTLNERIDGLNKIIDVYKSKEGDYSEQIKTLQEQKANYVKEKAIYENEIAKLNKQLVKSKRGKKWLAIGGLSSTIAGFVLGVLLSR